MGEWVRGREKGGGVEVIQSFSRSIRVVADSFLVFARQERKEEEEKKRGSEDKRSESEGEKEREKRR